MTFVTSNHRIIQQHNFNLKMLNTIYKLISKNKFYVLLLILILKNRNYIDFYYKRAYNWLWYFSKAKFINTHVFRYSLLIPNISRKVAKSIQGVQNSIHNEITNLQEGLFRATKLTQSGINLEELKIKLSNMKNINNKHHQATQLSGAVYNSPEHSEIELIKYCIDLFYKTNPLHADIYPSLITMEKDIINITKNLFNLPVDKGTGTLTTGGTESIILALFCYREYAKKTKGITRPEIVVPRTIHPAFDKGCAYMNIKINKINIDNSNNLDYTMLTSHINHNTILLVGSAPSFPHGLMDDIEKLSEIALRYNIPLHVDACLGGFILPFMNTNTDNGELAYKYDFLLPGVTSMSADTHKYGCCPKGSSVLLFRDKKMFESIYFIQSDWMGGIYATTNITGSRSGLSIAWTWAILNNLGKDKFIQNAASITLGVEKIKQAFNNDSDIFIYGNPQICVLGFGSNTINIYKISNKMKQLGWNLNELQNPASFHLCITNCHRSSIIDKFISDMRNSINEVVLLARNTVSESESETEHYSGVDEVILDKTDIDNNDTHANEPITIANDTNTQDNDFDSGASI